MSAEAGGQALAESQLPEEQGPVGTSEISEEVLFHFRD